MYSASNNVTVSGVASGITTTLGWCNDKFYNTDSNTITSANWILLQVMMVQILQLRLVMKLFKVQKQMQQQLLQVLEDMMVRQQLLILMVQL